MALVLLWPWLFVVDLLGFMAWLVPLALISMPFWYRYSRQRLRQRDARPRHRAGLFPGRPARRDALRLVHRQCARPLSIAAGVGLALLVLVGNYAVVGAARMHVRAVARWLGARDSARDGVRQPRLDSAMAASITPRTARVGAATT